MLELLGTIFGSIFSGGATGILGVIAQRYADYKNKQLDVQLEQQRYDNAIAMKKLDAEIAIHEAAAHLQIVTVEGETQKDVARINANALIESKDAEAFAKSYDLEPKLYHSGKLTPGQNWLMVLLDAFRGAVRPLLTVYLCVITTAIYIESIKMTHSVPLSVQDILEMNKLIVSTILYLTTTIVLWWFGTRNKGKP